MKKLLSLLIAAVSVQFAFSQNVGIGTLIPTDAKLQVQAAGNTTQGMFTDGTTGVALLTEASRPAIGFNTYLNSGYKFKGAGYGGLFYYLPTSGNLSYYTTNASGAAGAGAVFGSSLLTIRQDGNVGIGASPTEAKLQIHEPAGNTQFIAAAGSNLPGISTFVPGSSPSIGYNVRYQSGYKYMGAGYGAFWQYTPSLGALYYFYSSTSGAADGNVSSIFALAIDSSGRLGIGTGTPKAPLHVTGNVVFGSGSISPATGYKVSIDGKVICEEIKVQVSTSWPDYVFEDNYNLPSLEAVEAKTMAEKHLPGIPSAADVKAQQGIEIGDMQKRMLEKMEEMYRYMFQINKENKEIKKDNKALKDEVATLRKQLQPILQ